VSLLENDLKIGKILIGVDEAGRGPLAGPLVVCACHLVKPVDGVKDSKQLSEKKRLELAKQIVMNSELEITVISTKSIDNSNIHKATLDAMGLVSRRLLSRISGPGKILIDGKFIPTGLPWETIPIIDGDCLHLCIAAASIVAKSVRDYIMIGYDDCYPGYGFRIHKGYGTQSHFDALERLGPCQLHRRSFNLCRSSTKKIT